MKATEVNSRRITRISIWEEIRLNKFNGDTVIQGKKERIKTIKQCDMCGINILHGKHCKPCSSDIKIGNGGSAILDKVYKVWE